MKQKEDLEHYQSTRLAEGLPVQEIRHHQQFISNLQNQIEISKNGHKCQKSYEL